MEEEVARGAIRLMTESRSLTSDDLSRSRPVSVLEVLAGLPPVNSA
jgi:hypothetical protein